MRVCNIFSRRPRSRWNGWIISNSKIPLEPNV